MRETRKRKEDEDEREKIRQTLWRRDDETGEGQKKNTEHREETRSFVCGEIFGGEEPRERNQQSGKNEQEVAINEEKRESEAIAEEKNVHVLTDIVERFRFDRAVLGDVLFGRLMKEAVESEAVRVNEDGEGDREKETHHEEGKGTLSVVSVEGECCECEVKKAEEPDRGGWHAFPS